MQPSLKQRSHSLGYILNSPVSVPYCPECHSYPCACDDNIIEKPLGPLELLESLDVNNNWSNLIHMENR